MRRGRTVTRFGGGVQRKITYKIAGLFEPTHRQTEQRSCRPMFPEYRAQDVRDLAQGGARLHGREQ
jgi:hypothetical protein